MAFLTGVYNTTIWEFILLNLRPNQRNSKTEINLFTKMNFPDDYKDRFVIERSFA